MLYYYSDKFISKSDTLSQKLDISGSLYNNKGMVLLKPKFLVVYIIKELAFKEEEYSLLSNICQSNKVSKKN